MPYLILPETLSIFTRGSKKIKIEGRSLQDALKDLKNKFPELYDKIISKDGNPKRFVKIFINDQEILGKESYRQSIEPGTKILVLMALAGG